MSNKNARWILAAMAAPLTQAASNCSWPAVLTVTILSGLVTYGMERLEIAETKNRVFGAVQWLWMLLVISEFMHWCMFCWPEHRNYHALPLVLLALSAFAVTKGKERTATIGLVLFWFLAVILGAILLTGIKEVKLKNLKPEWRMQTAHLVTVMFIPAMGKLRPAENRIRIIGYALAVSLVTTGVMTIELIQQLDAPFYEMSRSLTFLGGGLRFESLISAGLTLGYYILLTYLVTVTADAWEMGKRHNRGIWISAAFAALVFISGMRLNSRILAVGTMAVWVILPALEKTSKMIKKGIDK